MALPRIDTPTYQLKLPSTQEIIEYRPFLMKEQKIASKKAKTVHRRRDLDSLG